MNKLNNSLVIRLKDIGRRMDSIPEQTFLAEIHRVRDAYKEELAKIMAEHEADQ